MEDIKNIVVLGRRNAGKSSLVNLLTGQQVSIVSPVKGTTTDPVRKRMEFPGIGPCNIVDTAGIDDSGDVGLLRSGRSRSEAVVSDLALLLFTGNSFSEYERELALWLKDNRVPFILIHNQEDIEPLEEDLRATLSEEFKSPVLRFTCLNKLSEMYIKELTDAAADTLNNIEHTDIELIPPALAKESDRVLLVCPIDRGAPQGRLILPQVMTLRSLLDKGAVVTVAQPSQLKDIFHSNCASRSAEEFETLCRDYLDKNGGGCEHIASGANAEICAQSGKFKVVITDSQAFSEVASQVPEGIPVGSFSILMARKKGPFNLFLKSVSAIDSLKDGDKVLILESCTHRASCDDIGRVKIPNLLKSYTGKNLSFEFVSGLDSIPEQSSYALAIQCGGCMATSRQISARVKFVAEKSVPVTNYGMAIAYMKGLFKSENFKAFLNLIGEQ